MRPTHLRDPLFHLNNPPKRSNFARSFLVARTVPRHETRNAGLRQREERSHVVCVEAFYQEATEWMKREGPGGFAGRLSVEKGDAETAKRAW